MKDEKKKDRRETRDERERREKEQTQTGVVAQRGQLQGNEDTCVHICFYCFGRALVLWLYRLSRFELRLSSQDIGTTFSSLSLALPLAQTCIS